MNGLAGFSAPALNEDIATATQLYVAV